MFQHQLGTLSAGAYITILTLANLFAKYDYNDVKEDATCRECSMHGAKRNAYRILAGKPEGKKPLGRTRSWWEGNIKMYLTDGIGWYGLD
jgi:hypothetical protein